MSQTTCCPACQTRFRVVADQLKIAQGWVRCGRCGEVFDASPQPAPESAPALAPLPPAENAAPAPDGSVLADAAGGPHAGTATPPIAEASPDAAILGDTRQAQAAGDHAAGEVSFVREALRREFWKRPLTRVMFATLAMVLLTVLVLQLTLQQKDALVALHPRLVPLFEALCKPLGCNIRPLRRIASLVIDSTSFVKTGPDTYRLGFVLKNNDMVPLEIPVMELTLTDSREQTVVRRVLTPAQFGAGATTLGAHLELAGAVLLTVAAESSRGPAPSQPGASPIAGYRLLAFYP